MTYHVIPRRYAVTPGIGEDGFNQESGELTDLPTAVTDPGGATCPAGTKRVLARTGQRWPETGELMFRTVACVAQCPPNFFSTAEEDDVCITYEDYQESIHPSVEPTASIQASPIKVSPATAAVVAGGGILALLAFLL